MILNWNRRLNFVVMGLLLVALGGCSQIPVPSSTAPQMRGQQTIALDNGYNAETQQYVSPELKGYFGIYVPTSLVFALKNATEATIAVLGKEMASKGYTIAPATAGSPASRLTKSVILLVHSVGGQDGFWSGTRSLVLEAEYGDGTRSTIKGHGSSGISRGRAFDDAMVSAVSQLLRDERFLSYVNK